jgi:demethylmenaquinone methyltransferase/2-methoxy-6-polyprenyl-1,4-benzoquinol methylase
MKATDFARDVAQNYKMLFISQVVLGCKRYSMFSTQDIKAKYRRQAKRYDFAVQLYRLLGLRIKAYRLRAVELLRLTRGDCVVDLGCGTGLNFDLLIERIGPEGRLIGVDLSPDMLAGARERAQRSGWSNIEFVQSDIAAYDFPEGINAVLSTGAFGYVTEYARVKAPERWPLWLFKLFVRLSRPFGVTTEYFDHPCWEPVERFFQEVQFEERYGGLMYISSGTG